VKAPDLNTKYIKIKLKLKIFLWFVTIWQRELKKYLKIVISNRIGSSVWSMAAILEARNKLGSRVKQ